MTTTLGNELKLVNLGCGTHYHAAWINLDVNPLAKDVGLLDLNRPLPFIDDSVDVVYLSHVIEHFAFEDGKRVLGDIFRVLKPQGVIRIVTPDLESLARSYLERLHEAVEGRVLADAKYEWTILELFDQAVRSQRGGEMARFLRRADASIRGFIRSRVGHEVEGYWGKELSPPSFWNKFCNLNKINLLQFGRNLVAEALVFLTAGRRSAQAFRIGVFRQSGEIHYRLYDRYSLHKAMSSVGFTRIRVCRADESVIPDFNSYQLDTINGEIRKPDSMFVEAVK